MSFMIVGSWSARRRLGYIQGMLAVGGWGYLGFVRQEEMVSRLASLAREVNEKNG